MANLDCDLPCTAEHPNPDARRHPDAVDVGTCSEGCCDKYECPNCHKRWLEEVGD